MNEKEKSPEQRIPLICADIQSIYYAVLFNRGVEKRLDYRKLFTHLKTQYPNAIFVAYVGLSKDFDNRKFLSMLKNLGYTIVSRPLGKRNVVSGEWSGWILMDILNYTNYEPVVVITGSHKILKIREMLDNLGRKYKVYWVGTETEELEGVSYLADSFFIEAKKKDKIKAV